MYIFGCMPVQYHFYCQQSHSFQIKVASNDSIESTKDQELTVVEVPAVENIAAEIIEAAPAAVQESAECKMDVPVIDAAEPVMTPTRTSPKRASPEPAETESPSKITRAE